MFPLNTDVESVFSLTGIFKYDALRAGKCLVS
jgi:hypothetical protein